MRRVYQHLFTDVADIFLSIFSIHSLDADEIYQLNNDLKSNGWGAINFIEIENSLELVWNFQLIYHLQTFYW